MSKRMAAAKILMILLVFSSNLTVHAGEVVKGSPVIPSDLARLVRLLNSAGFRVLHSKPPIQGAYGATSIKTKTIWIAPITHDLGIFRQSLIHEAVHAIQGCRRGILEPVGWKIMLPNLIDREVAGIMYRNYPHAKHDIEREAFAIQGHPNALALLERSFRDRCLNSKLAAN